MFKEVMKSLLSDKQEDGIVRKVSRNGEHHTALEHAGEMTISYMRQDDSIICSIVFIPFETVEGICPQHGVTLLGVAKRNRHDKWNTELGQALAFERALRRG